MPQLLPEELLAPAAVIDISQRAASDPDAQVEPDDLQRYERRHGRIPRGAVVLMDSGWAAKVNDNAAFKNADAGGTYHFPGFGIDAVEWLLDRRDIRGIGVDTLSLDPGNSTTFDVHKRLLGADRYGIENVANLSALRPQGRVRVGRRHPVGGGLGRPLPRARLRVSLRGHRPLDSQVRLVWSEFE